MFGANAKAPATPYRVVLNVADAGYKCTCPSRKFPCKHALALMWMRADRSAAFAAATAPDWVEGLALPQARNIELGKRD